MRPVAIAFGVVLCLSGFSAAQDSVPSNPGSGVAAVGQAKTEIDAAKEADIRRLLALLHTDALSIQAEDTMEKAIQPLLFNSLPAGEYREKLVTLFFEKFRQHSDPQHLTDLMVPIYDKYYTADEIKQLIQLYQTPIGEKLITVLPKILAESQAAGAEWGRQLGRQSMREVLAEHPELSKALEEAQKNAPRQP